MIIYDLNIVIYNVKNCEFVNENSNFYWMNLFITNDYIIFIYFNMIIKWSFVFFYEIKDKNLDSGKIWYYKGMNCMYDAYSDDDYKYARNHLVQISDNLFTVVSEINNQSRIIYFAEIKTKENFEPLDEDESLYCHEIEIILINEMGDINIFPINKENCRIVCGYKNYIIYVI